MSATERQQRQESTFERLEKQLPDLGEMMVRTASGEEVELHEHNVEFGPEPYIEIDADDAVHWLDARKIERYWVHEQL